MSHHLKSYFILFLSLITRPTDILGDELLHLTTFIKVDVHFVVRV